MLVFKVLSTWFLLSLTRAQIFCGSDVRRQKYMMKPSKSLSLQQNNSTFSQRPFVVMITLWKSNSNVGTTTEALSGFL